MRSIAKRIQAATALALLIAGCGGSGFESGGDNGAPVAKTTQAVCAEDCGAYACANGQCNNFCRNDDYCVAGAHCRDSDATCYFPGPLACFPYSTDDDGATCGTECRHDSQCAEGAHCVDNSYCAPN